MIHARVMSLAGPRASRPAHGGERAPAKSKLRLLSPLGERLGEGVVQETVSALTPSPNLSPKGERNMTKQAAGPWPA
jgi:hypothetical protein